MILFLAELMREVIVEIRLMRVLHHAQGKAFADGDIVQVMLQGEALEPFSGELSFSQLGKVADIHKLFHARLDELSNERVDKTPIFHDTLPYWDWFHPAEPFYGPEAAQK
jgi:hypothetical protein